MAKFYWVRKECGLKSERDGVGQTAHTVIADYIDKNRDKTAEQLRSDLDIRGTRGNDWDDTGHHPFTLAKRVPDGQNPSRYFPETIRLDGGQEIRISNQWGTRNASEGKWNMLKTKMQELGYTIYEDNNDTSTEEAEGLISSVMSIEVSLLQQFKQIILYGPPGTGKTFRAKTEILPELLNLDKNKKDKNKSELDEEQGNRWDIVQFHPSYNYEDFVRGVKVDTVDNKVVYKTIDRIFGVMCKRAKDNPDNDYALIIDEINRADVSAVLGELIYALEYRGEQIDTPYAIDDKKDSHAGVKKDSTLIVPKNLYIIGTMNTADRTIGQIDYAVRRRFAFVQCLPDESVINDDVIDVFSDVDELFDKKKGYISSDYDGNDVRIGHSYFLTKPHESIAHKIIYQVVPILREYVKDGVLLKGAEEKITAIENSFKNDVTIDDESSDASNQGARRKLDIFYYWGKEERFVDGAEGIKGRDDTVRRSCFVNIEDMQERCNWDSCEEIGFVLASGVSNVEEVAKAKGRIHRILPGYIVVASLLQDSQGNGGVIGMGEVLAEAVPINEFNVNGAPILDYEFSNGQKYREKFPLAAADADDTEKCDWMVAVKWINTLPRKDAEGPSKRPRTVFRVSPRKMDIINRKFGKRK